MWVVEVVESAMRSISVWRGESQELKEQPTCDSDSALCRTSIPSGLVGLVAEAEFNELLKLLLGVGVWDCVSSPLTPLVIELPVEENPSEVCTFRVAPGSGGPPRLFFDLNKKAIVNTRTS